MPWEHDYFKCMHEKATYKKPFDVIAEGAKKEIWYPQGNSNPRRLREREVS